MDTCSASHPGPPAEGTCGAPPSRLGRGGEAGGQRECDGRRPRSARRPACLHLQRAHPHSEIILAPGEVFLREPWLLHTPMPPSGAPSQQQGLHLISMTPWCEGASGLSHNVTPQVWAAPANPILCWGGGRREGATPPGLHPGPLLTKSVVRFPALHVPALHAPAGASSPQGSGCPQPALSITGTSGIFGERVLAFGLPATPPSCPVPEMLLGSLR